MFVAWGNGARLPLQRLRTPRSSAPSIPARSGSRFHDIWSEIWSDISPLIDAAMAGQATYREDLPLVMNRKGYDEQTWFTFSYSPVRDESGKVAGMFCAVLGDDAEGAGGARAARERRATRALNETLERRVDRGARRAEDPRRHRRRHERLRAGRRPRLSMAGDQQRRRRRVRADLRRSSARPATACSSCWRRSRSISAT